MKFIKWLNAPMRKARIAERIMEKYALPRFHSLFGKRFLVELQLTRDYYYGPYTGKKIFVQHFPTVEVYLWTGHSRYSWAFSNIRFTRHGKPANRKTEELLGLSNNSQTFFENPINKEKENGTSAKKDPKSNQEGH